MEKEQKITLGRIIASVILLAVAWLLPLDGWAKLAVFLVPYLIAGSETLLEAGEGIIHGDVFDEDFLMSIATIGAFVLGDYPEAVFVMVFFQIGELFEDLAEERSRKSITALMDIRPDYANLERDGELVAVDPETVEVGSVIVVKPGEKIPLDGEILEGESRLDTAALTGESVPRTVRAGDAVISGCVNLNGLLRLRVTKPYGESTVSRILEMVETSAESKSRSENFITRFAAWYTPVVCGVAVLLAVIPSLFTGEWGTWVHRGLVFLVASCPCALVLSVPLTFFAGIGGASKKGVLIKGSVYMDALCDAEIAVFDKTGTLTRGSFSVTKLLPNGCSEEELLRTAAAAESFSDHPIARSLKAALPAGVSVGAETAEDLTGRGIRAVVDGKKVLAGNRRLMTEQGIACDAVDAVGTVIYVAREGAYLGAIVVSDEIKPDSAATMQDLRAAGVKKTVMLTGDRKATAEAVAKQIGLDEVHAELLPGDKVSAVEELLSEKSRKGRLVFVGDGINDAPVLARADVGVAMGGLGSDAAIEAADVVLMDDNPHKLVDAIRCSRSTKRIVMQNIVFCLAIKALVLGLAVPGIAGMWAASFADVGVCVLAVLNAMRAMRVK